MKHYPQSQKTFKAFLVEIKKKTLAAHENQDYRFEDLVDKITERCHLNKSRVFNVAFELQTLDFPKFEIPGVKITPVEYKNKIAKFDVTFVADERDEKLFFSIEYRSKRFKKNTMEKFCKYYMDILAQVIKNKDIKLMDIKISHYLLTPKAKVPEINLRF